MTTQFHVHTCRPTRHLIQVGVEKNAPFGAGNFPHRPQTTYDHVVPTAVACWWACARGGTEGQKHILHDANDDDDDGGGAGGADADEDKSDGGGGADYDGGSGVRTPCRPGTLGPWPWVPGALGT